MWMKTETTGGSCTFLAAMQNNAAYLENSLEISLKFKCSSAHNPVIALPYAYPGEIKTHVDINTCIFIFRAYTYMCVVSVCVQKIEIITMCINKWMY